jgi:hyperosmotically inducible periplasmic protein
VNRTALHWIAALALATLGTTSAMAATTQDVARETQARLDDTLLTARVKGALITDQITKAHRISIETFRGVIQLSGFVASENEKTRAGEVVAAVPGVVEVRNAIEVRRTLANRDAGQVLDDASVSTRVKAALIADENTGARDIGVETYQGVVQLSGFVGSSSERRQASRVARDVDGVEQVRNDLQIEH